MTTQGLQPKHSNGNIFSITINNNNNNDSNNNNIGIDAEKSIIDENHLHVRKDDDDEINNKSILYHNHRRKNHSLNLCFF